MALSHHWLTNRRGGEKVLEALKSLFPTAPLYTLVHDPRFRFEPDDPQREIFTSPLQYLPYSFYIYPALLPLMPRAFRLTRIRDVDLVLCSDAALAKLISIPESARLVCYCHSPPRYLWGDEVAADYFARVPAPLRPLARWLAQRLRADDFAGAQRVDRFIANSEFVAARIQRHYQREAHVVYPPVDLPLRPIRSSRSDDLLVVGHHVPYKRLDLAVDVAKQLKRNLRVIGEGPDVKRLKRRRNPHVDFLGYQTDAELRDHYMTAAALLFPGVEDFGIVPVEAFAHGCPVIAYGVGGASESVEHLVTGVLAPEQSVDALSAAAEIAFKTPWDPAEMWERSQSFSRVRFLEQIQAILEAEGGATD